MHSFEVHSNESICRKGGRLGLEQVSCITIQILEICVWKIVILMVMYMIYFLNDKILDVVSTQYIKCPIIKMDFMAIVEEH